MKTSKIAQKLSRDEAVLITLLHFRDPSLFEMVSLMGMDGIWLDTEHFPASDTIARELIRAARLGNSDMIVRVARGEFSRISRVFESNAQVVVYPRCQSAAEAKDVVDWAKFAPIGKRGFDGGGPDMRYCSMDMEEYLKLANENTLVFIQLEDPLAIEHAEAIAAVPGVDAVILGPADYSIACACPGQFDSIHHQKAREALAKAARNTGKHWGHPAPNSEAAGELITQGARIIWHGADLTLIKNGLKAVQDDFARLGMNFANELDPRGKSYMEIDHTKTK